MRRHHLAAAIDGQHAIGSHQSKAHLGPDASTAGVRAPGGCCEPTLMAASNRARHAASWRSTAQGPDTFNATGGWPDPQQRSRTDFAALARRLPRSSPSNAVPVVSQKSVRWWAGPRSGRPHLPPVVRAVAPGSPRRPAFDRSCCTLLLSLAPEGAETTLTALSSRWVVAAGNLNPPGRSQARMPAGNRRGQDKARVHTSRPRSGQARRQRRQPAIGLLVRESCRISTCPRLAAQAHGRTSSPLQGQRWGDRVPTRHGCIGAETGGGGTLGLDRREGNDQLRSSRANLSLGCGLRAAAGPTKGASDQISAMAQSNQAAHHPPAGPGGGQIGRRATTSPSGQEPPATPGGAGQLRAGW